MDPAPNVADALFAIAAAMIEAGETKAKATREAGEAIAAAIRDAGAG